MDDNGRFLSFQLQSPQDSRVFSVNYTLRVTPSVEGEQLACGVVVLMCTKLCDDTVSCRACIYDVHTVLC